ASLIWTLAAGPLTLVTFTIAPRRALVLNVLRCAADSVPQLWTLNLYGLAARLVPAGCDLVARGDAADGPDGPAEPPHPARLAASPVAASTESASALRIRTSLRSAVMGPGCRPVPARRAWESTERRGRRLTDRAGRAGMSVRRATMAWWSR